MTQIACLSGVERLMDYLEGVLTADECSAIDAHVAGCPKCVAFIASYRETPRILREATAMSMPADLQASLRACLLTRRGMPPAPD